MQMFQNPKLNIKIFKGSKISQKDNKKLTTLYPKQLINHTIGYMHIKNKEAHKRSWNLRKKLIKLKLKGKLANKGITLRSHAFSRNNMRWIYC